MTVSSPPQFQQNAGSVYTAEQMRRVFKAAQDGGQAGVVGNADLTVTQNGTPNMSVNVASGECWVAGSETTAQGLYYAYNDATVNLAIAASDPTNPRNDLVVMRVRDAFYSGANNDVALFVVTGTPAGSPVDPTVPADSFKIARVRVDATVTTIVNAKITDLRTWSRAKVTPGGGGWQVTDSTGSNSNIITTDAGIVTLRNALQLPISAGGSVATTAFGSVPVKLAETTLGSATASVTFSSIPGGFRHLMFTFICQTDQATAQDLRVRFNGDSGANYYNAGYSLTTGGTVVNQFQAGLASGYSGTMGTLSTNGYGIVSSYTTGILAKGFQVAVSRLDSGVASCHFNANIWTNTGVITSMTFLAGAGNINTNSMFCLYGIP